MKKAKEYVQTILVLLCVTVVSACSSRSLTTNEIVLASEYFGRSVDYERVKVVKGGPANVVTEFGGAVVDDTIYFHSDRYVDDFALSIYVDDHMLFIHEVAHVWQYQNGEVNGGSQPYRWALGANEHARFGEEVYEYPALTGEECLNRFRFEQQGQIMGDYVFNKTLGRSEQQAIYESVIYGGCGITKGMVLPGKMREGSPFRIPHK